MKENPLITLQQFGQSIWLDYLHRRMFDSGELARLIAEDGLRGVTSNPAIFQKAIGGSEVDLSDFAALQQAATKPGHAEALRFVRKLTAAPHTIDDADVARLRESFSDHEVAEIIDLTCDANAFDRFTEVLRLPVEF